MVDTNLLVSAICIGFAILSGALGNKYRKYKDAFVKVAEAVKDDKVTWDEAKGIVKELEE